MCVEGKWKRDAIGYRGERQGEGKDGGGSAAKDAWSLLE